MLWDKELWDCRSSGTRSSVSGRKVSSNHWVKCPSYHLQESPGDLFTRHRQVCLCVHVCICMYVCVRVYVFLTSKSVYVLRFLFNRLKTRGLRHNWKNSSVQWLSDHSRQCLWDRTTYIALGGKCMRDSLHDRWVQTPHMHLFLKWSIINL